MKKLIILCSCLLLTGCGNSSETDETTSQTETNQEQNNGSTVEEQEEAIENGDITLTKGVMETISSTYLDDEIEIEITYVDSWISNELNPSEPREDYFYHYEADEGETFVIYQFTVKNLSSDEIDSGDVLTNLFGDGCEDELIADGKYSYDGYATLEEVDANGYHSIGGMPYIDPLKESTVYYYVDIPLEAEGMTMSANVCVGDTKVNLGE